jgi:hypothetical protein
LYALPLQFKHLGNFLGALAVPQVQIIFRPREVLIYAEDHLGKSKVMVRINAARLHLYWCAKQVSIGLGAGDFGDIVRKIGKQHLNLSMVVDERDVERSVRMILQNPTHDDVNVIYLINLAQELRPAVEQEFADTSHAINFSMGAKEFEKMMNDIHGMRAVDLSFTQEKAGEPLVLAYKSANKKIDGSCTLRPQPDVLAIESRVSEDDSFRVDFKVECVKPIASIHRGDRIRVYLDERKRMLTCSTMDEGTIEIRTLTQFTDERPAAAAAAAGP